MISNDDLAVHVIACATGVSRPRIRAVLEIAEEIELTKRLTNMPMRIGKPECRMVDGCAVFAFPAARIVRSPEPSAAA